MPLDAQISVRLPEELAAKLARTAGARGVDRSDVVRDALRLYLEGTDEAGRPWDRIGELAGAARGGPSDLAGRSREHLQELMGGD